MDDAILSPEEIEEGRRLLSVTPPRDWTSSDDQLMRWLVANAGRLLNTAEIGSRHALRSAAMREEFRAQQEALRQRRDEKNARRRAKEEETTK